MFDIGFWELIILFGIGLIVLGPERLPKVAMQVGNWAGQARRMARTLTTQMRAELDADITKPFTPSYTPNKPGATPGYKRPGVDNLKPAAAENRIDGASEVDSADASTADASREADTSVAGPSEETDVNTGERQ
jgi:sec-independent protein translocase protein TatB